MGQKNGQNGRIILPNGGASSVVTREAPAHKVYPLGGDHVGAFEQPGVAPRFAEPVDPRVLLGTLAQWYGDATRTFSAIVREVVYLRARVEQLEAQAGVAPGEPPWPKGSEVPNPTADDRDNAQTAE